MRLAFVDTGALYALADRTDQAHGRARAFHESSRVAYLTTDFVLAEAMSLITKRVGKKQAVTFGILVGVLAYFLKKPLAAFLKERAELIRKSIDEAAKARAEAVAKLAAIEARMARLDGEIAERSRKMDAEAAQTLAFLKTMWAVGGKAPVQQLIKEITGAVR